MKLLERILDILAPFECLGCNLEGNLLCKACKAQLLLVPSRCYRCRKHSNGSKTCSSCRKATKISHLYVPVVYEGLAKELVWKLKYASAKAASSRIAELMLNKQAVNSNWVVVPVPTTNKRTRQRGYDQAKLIAKEFCRQSTLLYLDCLARIGSAHQVGASRSARKRQVKNAFYVKQTKSVKDCQVLLIDDVLTTGSTLEAAGEAVKNAGASKVSAMVFAQTE